MLAAQAKVATVRKSSVMALSDRYMTSHYCAVVTEIITPTWSN